MQNGKFVAGLVRNGFHRTCIGSAKRRKIDFVHSLSTSASEYQVRRSKLVSVVRKVSSGISQFLICVPAARTVYMAKDVPYPFRQNSDFRYLCGLTDPDLLLVVHSISASEYKSHIFLPDRTAEDERWHGSSKSEADIKRLSGVDFVHASSDLEGYLEKTFRSVHLSPVGLWYDPTSRLVPSKYDDSQPAIFSPLEDFVVQKPSNCVVLGRPTLCVQECRLLKSSAEASAIRRAASISTEAFKTAMKRTQAGWSERKLWATLEHESVENGADRLAFPPVCASGSSAAIIHYIENSQVMKFGDLVLVDSGCEVEGYCSDMSRVWPVDDKCSPSQQTLVDIVLWVQKTILDRIMNLGSDYGSYPTLDNLYHQMLVLLARQLRLHDVIRPRTSDTSGDTALVTQHFCGHHLGHYLGMDIHDCSDISRSRRLQEGMVFTVEPGIYIESGSKFAKPEFHGIGIRIEDDVYLGPDGPEVLTAGCPKDMASIQKLRFQL